MGAETYILIVGCYGLGCYLSYRVGRTIGEVKGIRKTVELTADMLGVEPDKLANDVVAYHKAANKSHKHA